MTIRERRMRLDMSIVELARKCNFGTSVMSRIERGLEDPPAAVIADIARVLECTPDEIKASIPSKEEVAKEQERLTKFLECVGACKANAKAKGYGVGCAGRGEVNCPSCGGKIRYSVAAVNGHICGARVPRLNA